MEKVGYQFSKKFKNVFCCPVGTKESKKIHTISCLLAKKECKTDETMRLKFWTQYFNKLFLYQNAQSCYANFDSLNLIPKKKEYFDSVSVKGCILTHFECQCYEVVKKWTAQRGEKDSRGGLRCIAHVIV